jgi:putative ABC transport system substrate-binding protein
MRSVFALLAALMVAAPAPGTREAPVRVAVVMSQESPAYRAALDGFRSFLKSKGLTAVVEVLIAAGDDDLTRQIHDGKPELVLAIGAGAAAVAVRQLAPAPVVAITLRRAELTALEAATGVYLEFPPEVELEWLKKILPRARRVGVVYNRAENAGAVSRASRAAAGLGLELVPRVVDSRERLPDALASLAHEAQVLWAIPDTLVLTPETARSFLLFQFRQRIPLVGLSDAWVKAGSLYALDRDWTDVGRQCGELAEQILKGSRTAGSLDPIPPRRVLYSVNRRTAERIKLDLPPDIARVAREANP